MSDTVTLPLDVLNVVLAVVLPMLVSLVTARFANSAVKTFVLVALTVISTALQQVFNDDGSFVVRSFVLTTTFQFLMSVGLHFGLLKPTNITGASGVIAVTVPAGIGGPSTVPGNVEQP